MLALKPVKSLDPVNLLLLCLRYYRPLRLVQWDCNRCNVTKVLKDHYQVVVYKVSVETNHKGSWWIFSDSFVTLAHWIRARHLTKIWFIRRSPIKFRPKTRQLKFTWIWANRPSLASKGSKPLFQKLKQIKPMKKVSNNKPLVRLIFLRHKLLNTNSIPKLFLLKENMSTHVIQISQFQFLDWFVRRASRGLITELIRSKHNSEKLCSPLLPLRSTKLANHSPHKCNLVTWKMFTKR